MKILWVSHFVPYPPKGGMLLRSWNLIKQLSEQNEIDLLALGRTDTFAGITENTSDALDEAYAKLDEVCRTVKFTPFPMVQGKPGPSKRIAIRAVLTGKPYSESWLSSKAMQKSFASMVANTEYDVIHIDTVALARFIDFDQRDKVSALYVLNHHNIESSMLMRRGEISGSPLMRSYFRYEAAKLRRLEQQFCSRYSMNLVCSDDDKENLSAICPDSKSMVVENGVDLEYFSANDEVPESPDSIVFVGGLSWYPNLHAMHFFAREIWPLLKSRLESAHFSLIGKNPDKELHKLAEQDPGFSVLGFVDDIRPVLDRSKIFVCPITDGGGTKLKILDAFAMQKCVVAHPFAVKGIKAIDGEHVHFATSAEEFVSKILALLKNDEARRATGLAARKLVKEQYSWQGICNKLQSGYSEMLNN